MSRNIVVCTDGTWNKARNYDGDVFAPTNVVKFCRAVAEKDANGQSQIRYYNPGVGTKFFQRVLGGMFGMGLSDNVKDAYRFLCQKYRSGDRVFLIGFSRGAYTARSLAGLISRFGILRPEFLPLVDDAYALYRQDLPHDHADIAGFRHAFGRDHTPLEMIGVWDTVGSLGIPGRINPIKRHYRFHDVKLSSRVAGAYHALAVDERRRPFIPSLWKIDPTAKQKVAQRWFVGAHSNVGGGYADPGLSDISLHWMIERAKDHHLAFDSDYCSMAIRPDVKGVLINSLTRLYQRMFRNRFRKIEIGVFGQSIDDSVYARMREVSGYRPANVPHFPGVTQSAPHEDADENDEVAPTDVAS